jgi:hypothetical protein
MRTIAYTAAWACLMAAAPSTLTSALAEGCTAIGTGQRCERRIESTTVTPDGTRWVTGATGDWSDEGHEAQNEPASPPQRPKRMYRSDVPAVHSKSVQAPGVSIDASGVRAPGVSIEWGN